MKFHQVQYPYTGLLSKQVQSYCGKPLFYYEVKLMGDPQQQASREPGLEIPNHGKNKDFSVGFATDDFAGQKIVGETKESIGLCGDGKIHCLELTATSPQQLVVNLAGDFQLQTGMIIGAGYIFKTHQFFFTMNGRFLKSVEAPDKLRQKALFPAISLGSRDNHRLRINLGQHFFRFGVDAYLQESYYQQIYRDIRAQSDIEYAPYR